MSNPNTPVADHARTRIVRADDSPCTESSGGHTFGRRQDGFPDRRSLTGAEPQDRPRRQFVPQIPESFILIGQVSLIPLLGIAAALIASRIPSLRADT